MRSYVSFMKKTSTVLLACSLASVNAYAGVYSDDLGKCLVNRTTENERQSVIKTLFAAIAQHPSTSHLANVTSQQNQEFMRNFASIVTELMTERCEDESRAAIKYEGLMAIQSSFALLGQIAMQDLMTDPSVSNYFDSVGNYLDDSKFEKIMK